MQLSLFDDKFILLNEGTSALITLDLEEAKTKLDLYKNRYSETGEVDRKLAMTEFLMKGFAGATASGTEESVYLYSLWNSFEDYVEAEGFRTPDLLQEIKKSFFSKLIASLNGRHGAENAWLCDSVPLGQLFIEAGDYDRAIASLQSALMAPSGNGNASLLYGYMGDAYTAKGELTVARKCYLEACLIDPQAIDWRRINDKELAALRRTLVRDRGMNDPEAAEWLPSYAYIEELFQPKALRLKDELKRFVNEYHALDGIYKKRGDAALKPKLFIRAIILCDNAAILQHVKGIDLIQLRAQMKASDGSLFNDYMKLMRSKRP